jgi:WD40 repeat protein
MPGADLAFSPNSRLLLAVDVAGTAAIWDLRRGMRIEPRGAIVANDSGLLPCDRFTGCGPWSPDSRSVAGANADYEASIWDADTGAAHALGVSDATGAAFDPDGARLAIVRLHGPALAVDRAGRRLASVPRGSRSQVSSASFVQDARHILTVDVDRKVALSDAARGTPAGPQASATLGGIGAAALSRDGSRLAIGTPAGVLQVHDTGSRRMRATAPQGRAISGVAFDRDGARIVTAHEDGSARIWNAASLGDPPVVLGGHSAPLLGAEFSPDGRLVLTAGTDGTARLWDAVLGTNILVLSTSDDGRARFSPDGRLIAIGGRRTVEVHTCELCERFDGLVRSARARLPQG